MDAKAIKAVCAKLRVLRVGNVDIDTEIMTLMVGERRALIGEGGVIQHAGRKFWTCMTPQGPVAKSDPDPFTRSLDAARFLRLPGSQYVVMEFGDGSGIAGAAMPGQPAQIDSHKFGTPEIALVCKFLELLALAAEQEPNPETVN